MNFYYINIPIFIKVYHDFNFKFFFLIFGQWKDQFYFLFLAEQLNFVNNKIEKSFPTYTLLKALVSLYKNISIGSCITQSMLNFSMKAQKACIIRTPNFKKIYNTTTVRSYI